jgi:TetR/AcrR family transcriptional regulator
VATARSTTRDPRTEARRNDILEAALRVFSDVGYARATTKTIAKEAGIKSPGLIYWYFASKEELLQTIFLRYAVVLDATSGANPDMDTPPEVALPAMARAALTFFQNEHVRRVYRLWMAEWPRLEALGISLERSGRTINVYTVAEAYFARQVAIQNLRPHDTWASARAFVALVWAQVEARHLFPSIYPTPRDDDEYVSRVIGLLVDGLRR